MLQAVIGGDRARHRLRQCRRSGGRRPRPRTIGLRPPARPLHQLQGAAVGALQAGIEQLPGLDLAGGGAAMLDDDVEAVLRADPGGHAELGVERADIGLDRARRHAGGAGRAIEAGADPALDAQGRLVDRDRDRVEGERAADAGDLDAQVEAGAEAQPLERAGDAAVRAGGRASGPRRCRGGCR